MSDKRDKLGDRYNKLIDRMLYKQDTTLTELLRADFDNVLYLLDRERYSEADDQLDDLERKLDNWESTANDPLYQSPSMLETNLETLVQDLLREVTPGSLGPAYELLYSSFAENLDNNNQRPSQDRFSTIGGTRNGFIAEFFNAHPETLSKEILEPLVRAAITKTQPTYVNTDTRIAFVTEWGNTHYAATSAQFLTWLDRAHPETPAASATPEASGASTSEGHTVPQQGGGTSSDTTALSRQMALIDLFWERYRTDRENMLRRLAQQASVSVEDILGGDTDLRNGFAQYEKSKSKESTQPEIRREFLTKDYIAAELDVAYNRKDSPDESAVLFKALINSAILAFTNQAPAIPLGDFMHAWIEAERSSSAGNFANAVYQWLKAHTRAEK